MLRKLIAACVGLAMMGVASTANGALVEIDFLSPGDGLITLDTDTNLEWLEVTLTINQSYNTVAGGFNGYTTTHGFSFADVNQVTQLYTNVGVTDQSGVLVSGNFAGVQELIALLGCTDSCGSGSSRFQQGWVDYDPFSPTSAALALIQSYQVSNTASSIVIGPITKDVYGPAAGSYLLRSVPLPGALPFMGTGLAVLGFLGWRRRKAA
jgi:hypothetical protein